MTDLNFGMYYLLREQEEGKGVNLHVVETEWEVKKFHKLFHDILERGGRGRNKTSYDIITWPNGIMSSPLIYE